MQETLVLFDVETVNDTLFAIGACVISMTQDQAAEGGFRLVIDPTEKIRFSVGGVQFPMKGTYGYDFWTRNATAFRTLSSEANPREDVASYLEKWLGQIGEKYPNATYASADGAVDMWMLSEFMTSSGLRPMTFFRTGNGECEFRKPVDTRSYAKGLLDSREPLCNPPEYALWKNVYRVFELCVDEDTGDAVPCMVNPYNHTHLPDDDAAEEAFNYMYVKMSLVIRASL